MGSIFSKIVSKEIPAYIVAEDENHLAFLDINPTTEGHTLVIPKKEVDYIFDLTDHDFQALHLFSKKVAKALQKTINCKRVGTIVVGTEVPHAHIHLIPFTNEIQMNLIASKKLSLSKEQFQNICEMIKKGF